MYTSHHKLSALQASNFSNYHAYQLISVRVPLATVLLLYGTAVLLPLRTVHLCAVLSVILNPISYPNSISIINTTHLAT